MSTTTDNPTIEKIHQKQIRRRWGNPTASASWLDDIDFLLAEVDRLKAENEAFGEFICRRCHLRQDAPTQKVDF